jgi:hypothetical protein
VTIRRVGLLVVAVFIAALAVAVGLQLQPSRPTPYGADGVPKPSASAAYPGSIEAMARHSQARTSEVQEAVDKATPRVVEGLLVLAYNDPGSVEAYEVFSSKLLRLDDSSSWNGRVCLWAKDLNIKVIAEFEGGTLTRTNFIQVESRDGITIRVDDRNKDLDLKLSKRGTVITSSTVTQLDEVYDIGIRALNQWNSGDSLATRPSGP